MTTVAIGEALRMRYQLSELARRHRISEPPIAALPLLDPVDHDVIVEGFAMTPDIDHHRMKFRPWSLFWPKQLVSLRHAHGEIAGSLKSYVMISAAVWLFVPA
jgi:hypothetical protein